MLVEVALTGVQSDSPLDSDATLAHQRLKPDSDPLPGAAGTSSHQCTNPR